MNTRHARIILTIIREGSFTAAAKALYITQPTLSQTVRQIETQLGESIFVRSHSSISLTPAGELYAQAARRIVQAETQLQESLSQLRGHAVGTLRLGLTVHRSVELLPQVLPDFNAAYPDVQLEVCEGSASRLEHMLLRSELDMALLTADRQNPSLEYRQIASEEIVLLAGKNTALAKRIASGSTIGLREAVSERFVLPAPSANSRAFYDDLFTSCGFTPDTRIVCDNTTAAMRCCSSCSLVTLSPFISFLCDTDCMHKLSHYHLGTDAYLPPIYMVCSKEQPLAPYAESFFTLLSRRFRAMTAYRL